MELSEREIVKIVKYLQKKVSPFLVYLFGSAAKGNMRADSDIDIAFSSDKEYNSYDIFIISQGLADLLKRDVDLVDLSKASTVFQAQIVGKGKVIYCSDEDRRMYFEMLVLKKYARLNEERQVILEKVRESGKIYGE